MFRNSAHAASEVARAGFRFLTMLRTAVGNPEWIFATFPRASAHRPAGAEVQGAAGHRDEHPVGGGDRAGLLAGAGGGSGPGKAWANRAGRRCLRWGTALSAAGVRGRPPPVRERAGAEGSVVVLGEPQQVRGEGLAALGVAADEHQRVVARDGAQDVV
ncbi:hypothetical protein GCM10010295_42320 [Streptomyces intermedius]